MEIVGEFSNSPIDEERDSGNQVEEDDFVNVIGDQKIIQLSNNCLPSWLEPLDNQFENNYVAIKPKIKPVSK